MEAVAREWLVQLPQEAVKDHKEEYLAKLMWGGFTIFYVDDAYFATRDPVFLQTTLDILVELVKRLETNCLKMQAMICTPGRICTQLPTASYHHMRLGYQTSEQWEARRVNCSHCNATLQAHSLPRPCHLATLHWVYQQTVVAQELLDECASVTLTAEQRPDGKLECPDDGCLGVLKDGWNMRRHLRDIHPRDKVIVKKEGQSYPQCGYCGMEMYPVVGGHWRTESCSIEVDMRVQRKAAFTSTSALAL